MAKAVDLFLHRLGVLLDPERRETATDSQLLGRWVATRDGRAFTALVGRHSALVWRVAWSFLHQPEDAEDAFQATFFVLARKAATLRKHTSIAGWLYQTARHLAIRARNSTARRRLQESQAAPKRVIDPLEEISIREAQVILAEELNGLPTVYREPLLLCHYEGATQDQAARQIGCSLNTLKRRLERGRSLLGRRLSRRGVAPGSALALTLCSHTKAPAQLVHQTITTATQFAAGQALPGTAALLAEGVLRTLMLNKLAVYCTLVFAVGTMTLAAGFAVTRETPTPVTQTSRVPQMQEVSQTPEIKDSEPRLDANGDPLPVRVVNRIGSSRLRHVSNVTRMLYTPDGKSIASTSGDFLYLWDATTGKRRLRLTTDGTEFQPQPVLAANGDGSKLAVLTDMGFLLIETATGRKLVSHQWPRPNQDGFVWCMAIAPDMGMVALGRDDATVRLHDAITGEEKVSIVVGQNPKIQFPFATEFSADGKAIYVLTSQMQDQKQNVIIAFDTHTGKVVQTVLLPKTGAADRHDRAHPKHLIRSHDNRILAVMEPGIISRTTTKIVLWDLKLGKQRHFSEIDLGRVYGGVFSPDDSLLAVASDMPYIALFDTATGLELEHRRLRAPPGTRSLTFSPDGKTLAFGDGASITLLDVVTGKHKPPSMEANAQGRIAFTNNGKRLVSVGEGVDWWDVTSAHSIRHLARDPEWYHISSVSPDGKLLAASMTNCDMALIDAVTGKKMRPLDGHKILQPVTAFSPDGSKLYSAGRHITEKPGFAGPDPRVIILDVASGKQLKVLQSEADQVDKLAVSPDGRWLASAAFEGGDRDIRVWDLSTGRVIHRLKPRRGVALAMVFSADSSRLASAGGVAGRSYDSGEVQVWNVSTGAEVCGFTAHKQWVTCVAMTPDGRMLATGSLDNSLRLWEVASGKERRQIVGHEANVCSIDFSPEGRLLAAASNDAPVYLWNAYPPDKSKFPAAKLAKADREKLWQELADTDAAAGFHAVCELIARPSETVPLLEDAWKLLPRATPKQMRKWLEDLGSDQFAVRKTATAELERFTAGHEDFLREALKKAGSLEARQRLEKLLTRLDPERLRRSRMLEVLEQIGTPEARQFLAALALQSEDAVMASEAAAGIRRLELMESLE